MVDFHTHILPRIDDGSSSAEMSVQMIKSDMEQGVDTFVFTPHFYASHNTTEHFLEKRSGAFEKLQAALSETELKPRMILGAELHYFPYVGSAEISELCIGDTDVILLEPPFRKLDKLFFKDVEDLVANQDFTVVIAHIERYVNRINAKKTISQLRDCGAYIQSNAEFLINQRWAINLYKDNYIDILGTDCHNLTERAPNIKAAANIIKSSLGDAYFDSFCRKAYDILELN